MGLIPVLLTVLISMVYAEDNSFTLEPLLNGPSGADHSTVDPAAPCTVCHDPRQGAVSTIMASVHGVAADKRTPFGGQACITCHGPSLQHRTSPPGGAMRALPDINFTGTATPATTKNAQCLQCHQRDVPAHWPGSIHEAQNLACTDCHNVHTAKDRILDKRNQPALCASCHKEKRAQMLRPSSHPLRDGQMSIAIILTGRVGHTSLSRGP
jgi:DmsE family decaheme c-type cytochrome